MSVRFNTELTVQQSTLVNDTVDFYMNKDSFSEIEQIAINWATYEYPVRDLLPTIEADLAALYNEADWDSYSYIEQRIFAKWNICSDVKRLEVFTQEVLDSFKFYNIYKFLEPNVLESVSKSDIHNVPREHDFKIEFLDKYYKKRFPKIEGRPTKKEYYATYNTVDNTYNDKFAELVFEFTDDSSNLILEKKAWLYWAWSTGEIDLDNRKDIGEIYHPVNDMDIRLKEAVFKRKAIDSDLQNEVVYFLMLTGDDQITASIKGVAFSKDIDNELEDWIRYGNFKQAELVTAITNAEVTHTWLSIDIGGITIGQYIINKISLT